MRALESNRLLALAALAMLPQFVGAYEQKTHQSMSEFAYYGSRVFTDPAIRNRWGLKPEVVAEMRFGLATAPEWLKTGAHHEDAGDRAFNHFYNPAIGKGFMGGRNRITNQPFTGVASPEWAHANAGNQYSYSRARASFVKALSAAGERERESAFGDVFRTLGQVIHHLQDMSQPQHTRNDPHCPWALCVLADIEFDKRLSPALYEKYSDGKNDNGELYQYFFTYPPAYPDLGETTFVAPRKFWETGGTSLDGVRTGKGASEFSYRNFVTAGTNFRGNRDRLVTAPGFPLPGLETVTVESTRNICEVSEFVRDQRSHLCGKHVNLVSNRITDTLSPAHDGSTSRISSFGVFDAELREAGATNIFTQNRIVFDDMHRFLIPRAVAYSTGLLNYFFRGDIAMERDADNPGKYKIRNKGKEELNGTFRLYYDDKDGNRNMAREWANETIPAESEKGGFEIAVPAGPAPAAEWTDKFLLVFSGRMGSEAPEGESPGAVTSAMVVAKPFVLFSGFREDDPVGPGNNGSFMEFHFMVPDDYLAAFRDKLMDFEFRVDGVPFPARSMIRDACSRIYCDTAFGQIVPAEWGLTTTRNNAFIVSDQYGNTIASGVGLAGHDALPDSMLCRGFTSNEFLILGYPPGSPGKIEVLIDGKLAFSFKVRQGPGIRAILSEGVNIRVHHRNCNLTYETTPP